MFSRGLSHYRSLYALALGVCLIASPALADEDKDKQEAKAENAKKKPDRTDFDLAPVAGGDSDIGIGVGQYSAFTHHEPGDQDEKDKYAWRVESGAFISFKPRDGGGPIQVPYQDDYLQLTLPNLIKRKVRLEIRPSFTEESTIKYYGLGNASKIGPIQDTSNAYYDYKRTHPTMAVHARLTLGKNIYAVVGNLYTHNWIDVPDNSRLAADMHGPDARVREILGGTKSHGVDLFEYALVYDDRDEEFSTHKGQYHQVKLRVSPGGTDALPYRYMQANVTLRGYYSPLGHYLTFAARLVGDVQIGNPPFYELARYDETFAIGGANGIRGVPAGRYYGKAKVIGNLEARSDLVPFKLFAKKFVLGVAGFFDAGRLWADTKPDAALDGTGIGLKYGVGGGLRLHQGDTFVVRFDVAWSPDATPVGAYFAAGQIF